MNHRCSRKTIGSWILAVGILFAVPPAWSHTAKDKDPQALENFAQVSDGVYRGAQPSAAGFSALQHMGVGIIVNFRNEPEEVSAEKLEVESLGMKYVGIPWSGRDNPSNAQVVEFLDLVRANPQTKIFVHCKRGADRTGTMVAAYRIAMQHQSAQEAVAEMHGFHYAHFLLPQLQRYVLSLPGLLHTDPLFSAYTIAPNLATEGSGNTSY